MKKIFTSFLLLAFLGVSTFAQMIDKHSFGSVYKPAYGDILTYEVDFFGTEYDFEVTIKELTPDKIVFDYYMTNQNRTQGTVTISSDALNSARAQMNFFRGGEVDLEDMTTVFLSHLVFGELVGDGQSTRISADGGSSWVELHNKGLKGDYGVAGLNNDNFRDEAFELDDLAHYYAQSADGEVKYWINYDPDFPLILKMDLGWKISLKHIERAP